MNKLKSKSMAISIAIFFILSMTASTMQIPSGNAHTPPFQIQTYAFISAQPNPVGVGQSVSLNFWIDKVPPTANGPFGDRWQNYTVQVTFPNGTTQNLGPYTSDDAGGGYTYFTPAQIGNYTFVFSFPGQKLAGANPAPQGTVSPASVGDYYQPSNSSPYVLTVQQTPSPLLPTNPLPTEYWTRPIFGNNLAWSTISGNWLGGGVGGNSGDVYNSTSNYDPYSNAPTTGHIMWTQPYAPGGLIGGEFGNNEVNSNYYSTAQYEEKFGGVIIDGVLYQTMEPGASTSYEGWKATNLRTGQTIWTQNYGPAVWLRMGQILDYVSPNQFGGLAYLWSTQPTVAPNTGPTYGMYDAMTGNWILSIVNCSATAATSSVVTALSVQFANGPNGEILGYWLNSAATTLSMWNSSLAIINYANLTGTGNWQWRPPQGANIPWSYGIQWTAPLANTETLANGTTVNINTQYAADSGISNPLLISKIADVILITNTPGPSNTFQEPGYINAMAYSPTTGALLWGPKNITVPAYCRIAISSIGDGVFTILANEPQSFWGYSTTTGQQLWGPVSLAVPNNPWGYYITNSIIGANNQMYVATFGGKVWDLNVTTGTIIWSNSTNTVSIDGAAGANTPYGVWTICNIVALTNGEFVTMGGHTYSPPLYNGAELFVWNTTNGDLLWQMPDFATSNSGEGVLSDGYLVVTNAYDNQLYCYGQGPSKLTVTAPDVGVTTSTPITITGTITDISAGSQQEAVAANFPSGLPCVSDASIGQFMEAVYMQQPMPTNVTGVPVTLSVIDSNGNNRQIGTTTTNALGTFGFNWTPDITGNYTVIATFAGSGSYYGSSAQTYFYASSPPATQAPTQAPQQSTVDQYFVPAVAGIIVAIAIVGVVLALLVLRKRP
jgi:hypothetical protein